MHTKIKYISITVGLLGLIPYGLLLIEKYFFINFFEIKTINFTIWYGITILSFLSGIYWGLSINALIKNNSDLNHFFTCIIDYTFLLCYWNSYSFKLFKYYFYCCRFLNLSNFR